MTKYGIMFKMKFLAACAAVMMFLLQPLAAQTNNAMAQMNTIQSMQNGGFAVNAGSASVEVMSDEEVIMYIMEEQAKGTDKNQIVFNLLRKGVTQTQLNRIRETYLSSKKDSGSKSAAGFGDLSSVPTRQRSNMQFSGLTFSIDSLDVVIPDSLTLADMAAPLKKKIFGHNIFANKNLTFEPNMNVATPETYRLGPGDEVIVDVWGDSQSTFRDFISPDGYVSIETLGLVYLNGKDIKEANEYLKQKYSQIYSGISGDEPVSQIKLTLGQTRSIQVRVMGEVENPGTYTVSAFASIFHALYLAGGVNEIGTMRNIKLSRANKEIATLDVYDYLLKGKTDGDVSLADGDVITVSTYGSLVNVKGGVKRPMFYEMTEYESLADLLGYSGGYSRNAYRRDVRVERAGEREMLMFTVKESEQGSFLLKDGDYITVDTIAESFENMVEVKGALYRPGKFQLGAVSSVKELIEVAGGLKPDAFMNRAVLNRRLQDMTMENVAVDLAGIMDGTASDIELRNYDVLYIPSLEDQKEIEYINIYGEVAFPGKYRFGENTSVEDVILMAGGLTERAAASRIEVVRKNFDPYALEANDTLANVFTFDIDKDLKIVGNEHFSLKPFDAIYIRRSPSYAAQKNVHIQGEVAFAGTYVLDNKNMRLSDLLSKAGGVTNSAYIKGARLERTLSNAERARMEQTLKVVLRQMDPEDVKKISVPKVQNVGIELDKAIENPGGEFDLLLKEGDRLIIPEYDNTVTISGNVMYPNTVSFKDGKKLKHYINQAGGYGVRAKKSKAIVIYKNGTVSRARKYSSNIEPGCEIIVPTKAPSRTWSAAEIFSLSSSSASLATVIISLINLLK